MREFSILHSPIFFTPTRKEEEKNPSTCIERGRQESTYLHRKCSSIPPYHQFFHSSPIRPVRITSCMRVTRPATFILLNMLSDARARPECFSVTPKQTRKEHILHEECTFLSVLILSDLLLDRESRAYWGSHIHTRVIKSRTKPTQRTCGRAYLRCRCQR